MGLRKDMLKKDDKAGTVEILEDREILARRWGRKICELNQHANIIM